MTFYNSHGRAHRVPFRGGFSRKDWGGKKFHGSQGSWNPKKNKEWQPRGRGQYRITSAGSQHESPCDREIHSRAKGHNKFSKCRPFVKELFLFPPKNLPLARRLSGCTETWAKLTSDPEILQTVKGCKMEFTQRPVKTTPIREYQFSVAEKEPTEKEIKDLESNGAVSRVSPVQDQFINNLFLVKKKEGKNRPAINLKQLNGFLDYHFKMENISVLKNLLRPTDWMVKLDLKDAYFCVLHKDFRKYLRFKWGSPTREFNCLPFGHGPAPRKFTNIQDIQASSSIPPKEGNALDYIHTQHNNPESESAGSDKEQIQ